MRKILDFIIYFTGGITLSILIVSIATIMAEKRKMKINKDNDPKLNTKHINHLIYRIRKEGYTVRAKGKYLVLDDILEIELSDKKID